MFIPFGTDAPLYYRPFGTVAVMVVNVLTFVLTVGGTAEGGWLLTFGNGLHPTEWMASAFLHFGFWHLVGNMVFLWTFGLIVEGKLGWWRFLLLYVGLCLLGGVVTQTLMLGYDGPSHGAGGASGVIFALMAIALVWAPGNNIDVFVMVFWRFLLRTFTFEVPVLLFSLFYIVLNFVFAGVGEFHMSSEMLHLLGAAGGFPVGAALLLLGKVDCEGWDLFSLWKREKQQIFGDMAGGGSSRTSAAQDHPPPIQRKIRPQDELRRIRKQVDAGHFFAASQKYLQLRERSDEAGLDEPRLKKLIDGLHHDSDWGSVVPLLEEYVSRFPETADRARLMLAAVLIREQQRPRAALRSLDGIREATLKPAQRKLLGTLRRAADEQIEEGVMELST